MGGNEMFSNLADWDYVFKTFEQRYQHLVDKMVKWYPSGRDEFTIVLNDGTKLVYNYFRDQVRRCYVPDDDSIELSDDDWSKEFSIRLKNKMRERRISRDQLSKITGISEVSISKYTNAKAIPSVRKARLISKALDCSMYELYEF